MPNEPEIREKWGCNQNSQRPMALLSGLYDPLNHLWIEARLGRYDSSERDLAAQHIKACTSVGDLVLYDRGYPAFWLYALHRSVGSGFCMRLPWNLYNEAADLCYAPEDQLETTITVQANKQAKEHCKELGIDDSPITLRLIRVKLDEPEGKETEETYQILITSLVDSETYSSNEFNLLYHQRWAIEEGIKEIKLRSELVNWSGRSVLAVKQDLQAKLLTLNLASLSIIASQLRVDARNYRKKLRLQYAANRAQALSRHKDALMKIFSTGDYAKWIEAFIEAIAKNTEAVRPVRSNPRQPRPAAGLRYKHSYKSTR